MVEPVDELDPTSFKVERRGPVLWVTFDNPRSTVNAVDRTAHDELVDLLEALGADGSARAIVLTGAGPCFSAGGDLDWIQGITAAERPALLRQGRRLIRGLLDIPVPIVAAVNGPAVGVGATLALLCDIVMAARSAGFADPHVRVGLSAGDGAVLSWPLVLGPAMAKRYLMTGDTLTAEEARALGLVTHLCEDDQLLAEAEDFARRLAELPPLAVQHTKATVNRMVRRAYEADFGEGLALEHHTLATDDLQEAIAAIKDRRPPSFRGH